MKKLEITSILASFTMTFFISSFGSIYAQTTTDQAEISENSTSIEDLPPELLHLIFTYTLESDPGSVKNILLTKKQWSEIIKRHSNKPEIQILFHLNTIKAELLKLDEDSVQLLQQNLGVLLNNYRLNAHYLNPSEIYQGLTRIISSIKKINQLILNPKFDVNLYYFTVSQIDQDQFRIYDGGLQIIFRLILALPIRQYQIQFTRADQLEIVKLIIHSWEDIERSPLIGDLYSLKSDIIDLVQKIIPFSHDKLNQNILNREIERERLQLILMLVNATRRVSFEFESKPFEEVAAMLNSVNCLTPQFKRLLNPDDYESIEEMENLDLSGKEVEEIRLLKVEYQPRTKALFQLSRLIKLLKSTISSPNISINIKSAFESSETSILSLLNDPDTRPYVLSELRNILKFPLSRDDITQEIQQELYNRFQILLPEQMATKRNHLEEQQNIEPPTPEAKSTKRQRKSKGQ